MSEPKQLVMSLMFNARIRTMASELRKMEPGELDHSALLDMHNETCRLLRGDVASDDAYVRAYGLPQESHEG
jgi:hypothetical protein